jgi:hypothetical protein
MPWSFHRGQHARRFSRSGDVPRGILAARPSQQPRLLPLGGFYEQQINFGIETIQPQLLMSRDWIPWVTVPMARHDAFRESSIAALCRGAGHCADMDGARQCDRAAAQVYRS